MAAISVWRYGNATDTVTGNFIHVCVTCVFCDKSTFWHDFDVIARRVYIIHYVQPTLCHTLIVGIDKFYDSRHVLNAIRDHTRRWLSAAPYIGAICN